MSIKGKRGWKGEGEKRRGSGERKEKKEREHPSTKSQKVERSN